MSASEDFRAEIAGKLTAAGILRVTLDPAALPPYVLVDAVTITRSVGVGGVAGELPIRCVVPPPGDAAALAALADMWEPVMWTLGASQAVPDLFGPNDLPSYTVTIPADLTNPNC